MLPYTPLHHLLLGAMAGPMVLTSGNVSDEPIAYRDEDALARLAGIADAFLTHDRAIHIRTDDSVARACPRPPAAGAPLPRLRPGTGRRARRLPPPGAGLRRRAEEHVLPGQGAARLRLAPHRGPGERETLRSFTEGIEHFRRLFDVDPQVVAYDLHPEYLSTKYALDLDGRGPGRRAAPPRPHRLLPGRQRLARATGRAVASSGWPSTAPATAPTAPSGAVSS